MDALRCIYERYKPDLLSVAKALLNDAAADPSQAAGNTEQRRIFADALAKLQYQQRQVVVLHVLGSLRFREIARQTGDSINTVQSRYRYGLAKLQSLLNGQVDL